MQYVRQRASLQLKMPLDGYWSAPESRSVCLVHKDLQHLSLCFTFSGRLHRRQEPSSSLSLQKEFPSKGLNLSSNLFMVIVTSYPVGSQVYSWWLWKALLWFTDKFVINSREKPAFSYMSCRYTCTRISTNFH